MDREWLAHRLTGGDSYEAIARAIDLHPSTVSYWARRHGLSSTHVAAHAARGGLESHVLAALVDAGLSTRQIAALHFHHVDPTEKSFGLARRGLTRSLDRCRAEARKCVLLCANCHAEIEAGLARLPFPSRA